MLNINSEYNFINSNFNINKEPKINFKQDSKNNIGIQIADILAGFTMRYINNSLKNKKNKKIHEEIFNKINYIKNSINYCVSISQYINLNINYTRNIELSNSAIKIESEYINFLKSQLHQ